MSNDTYPAPPNPPGPNPVVPPSPPAENYWQEILAFLERIASALELKA